MREPLEGLILIVDDDAEHQRLLTRALRRLGVQNSIYCVDDGTEMMRYFDGEGSYSDRLKHPPPRILFLNLDLPEMGGRAGLDWIQGSVISSNPRRFVYGQRRKVTELERIHNLGVDSVLKSPVQEMDLLDLIYRFPESWAIKVLPRPTDSFFSSSAQYPSS